MSDKKSENIYAFPGCPIYHSDGQIQPGSDGMTLRDYFAAAALTGILASKAGSAGYNQNLASFDAFATADAMLKVRDE